jgi:TPR repeat protein
MRPPIILLAQLLLLLGLPILSCAETEMPPEIVALHNKAEGGDADAQFRLGQIYDKGEVIPANTNESIRWWQRAGEQGNQEALFHLATRLLSLQRKAEAIAALKKAGDLGHAQALNTLGYIYQQGQGVEKNMFYAYDYYLQAANRGSAEAMWNLADMYGSGQYLARSDLMLGCIWARRSARFAGEKENNLRDFLGKVTPIIEQSLDPEEQNDCHIIADRWTPPQAPPPPPSRK